MASQSWRLASASGRSMSILEIWSLSQRTALPMEKHMGRQAVRYSIWARRATDVRWRERVAPWGVVYDSMTCFIQCKRIAFAMMRQLHILLVFYWLTFLNASSVASALVMLSLIANVLICCPSCSTAGCTSLSAWVIFMRFAMDR